MAQQSKRHTFMWSERNPSKIANEGVIYPPQSYIPAESVMVEDLGDGRKRKVKIRYVAGETSIFPSEQSNDAQADSDILISEGKASIREEEGVLLEYLRKTIYNEKNNYPDSGYRTKFKEVDFEAENEKAMHSIERKAEATVSFSKLFETPIKMRAICRKLGINVGITGYQMAGFKYVENKPEEFLKFMADSQKIELALRLDAIHQAVQLNKIRFSVGQWSWTGEGAFCTVPRGKEEYEYLAEWTFNDAAGRAVGARIKGLLSDEPDVRKVEETTRTEELAIDNMLMDEIFQEGKDLGVIRFEKAKFIYEDLEGNIHELAKSTKDALKALKSGDRDVLNELKTRISLNRREKGLNPDGTEKS